MRRRILTAYYALRLLNFSEKYALFVQTIIKRRSALTILIEKPAKNKENSYFLRGIDFIFQIDKTGVVFLTIKEGD